MNDTLLSIVVIGLGNPILSDDGIGWRVVQQVRRLLASQPGSLVNRSSVTVIEACVGGLSLAEMMIGYRRAIIVDATLTAGGVPGTVYQLKLADLPGTLNTASTHDTNLTTALQALRRFGACVPADEAVEIVAIEAADVWTFAEACTARVECSIPIAAEIVFRSLGLE